MTEVRIPFLAEFKEAMLSGRKIWTSRTKRYGFIGDNFQAFGASFEIIGLLRLPLKEIALSYRKEGFRDMADFIKCWCKIHPRKGYVADQKLWVHVFKKKEGVWRKQ